LDENGLASEADRSIYLLAGDNTEITPNGWTWNYVVSHDLIKPISGNFYAISDWVIDLASVKSYMYMKVLLMFDPPATSFAIASFEKMITELEVRLNLEAERTKI